MAVRRKQTFGKVDAAVEQIEAAIDLFYARWYAPSITLAGAAEGCLAGESSDDESAPLFELMKRGAEDRYGFCEKRAVRRFDAVRDWLKHEGKGDACEITDFDAWAMIVRAVSKLHAMFPASETPAIAEFVEYSRQYYTQATGGRPLSDGGRTGPFREGRV